VRALAAAVTVALGAPLHLPAHPPAREVSLPILMYHRVAPELPAAGPPITRRLTVATPDFAAQMTWLKRHGWHAVTQEQVFAALERGARLPRKPVAITFDDGYRDVLWQAAPVLARLHMPATEYVITDRISGPDISFLTWPQLRRLERAGIAIGSHTVTHRNLTTLSPGDALVELRASRGTLERRLGHPVQWLAYPEGGVNAGVVALAQRAGYVLAVTTSPGRVQSSQSPLELHRYEVLDTTGVAGVASMLGGS
jgi:peptidoglycan/xylan/chitin deacetylase (PgdA/CDA1 family)